MCLLLGAGDLGRHRWLDHALGSRGGPADEDGGETPPPPPPPSRDPRSEASVFFLGHSLVNWDMPAMVAGIAAHFSLEHEWAAHIGNGASLSWIFENPTRGEGEDPHASISSGRFDTLLMTEAVPLQDQYEFNDTVGYTGRFVDLAVGGDPGTQVYFYETWHSRTGDYDWRARIDDDRALWERIVDETNAAHGGPDMLLIPAGTAMAQLHDRIVAVGVPGISDIDSIFADDIHLNDVGNYFVACVVYATMYRRSPVGAAHQLDDRFATPFAPPSEAQAAVFQEIAWDVVARDPRAGVAAP